MQVSCTIRAPVTATPRIAIVGAGFTGTLLAVHLLREARTPVIIHLFEQHGWFGRGVAYSTGNPSHLLNVRVANMSAFPDDPADFLLWLWRFDYHVDGMPIPPSGHAFVPRGVYGTYLEDTLSAACKAAAPGVDCQTRAVEVVGVGGVGIAIALSFRGAAPAAFDHVVAVRREPASGPPAAEPSGDLDLPRYIADPWHEPGLTELAPDARVAIIGTGLTAVDVVLSLLDQGHKGPIMALSRRGLLPHAMRKPVSITDFMANEPAPESLLRCSLGCDGDPQSRSGWLRLAQRYRCVSPAHRTLLAGTARSRAAPLPPPRSSVLGSPPPSNGSPSGGATVGRLQERPACSSQGPVDGHRRRRRQIWCLRYRSRDGRMHTPARGARRSILRAPSSMSAASITRWWRAHCSTAWLVRTRSDLDWR